MSNSELDKLDRERAKQVKILEKKFANRGLVFTSPFEGFAPVQAYGHIDGMRFYFRLRGGDASLRVGVYDLQIEIERKQRTNEPWIRNMGFAPVRVVKESDPELYPSIVRSESYLGAAKLSMVELFSALVESLEVVGEDDQA